MSTALYVRDGERFHPTGLARSFWSNGVQHGGPPVGLLARAVEQVPTVVPMQVTRLTVDLFREVPIDNPLTVSTSVIRDGRRIQAVEASLVAAGQPVARASGLKIRTGDVPIPDSVASWSPPPGPDEAEPIAWGRFGFDITDRYVALWDELTTDLVIASDERYRIRERVGRLNDLGFAVDDVEIVPDGSSSLVHIAVSVGGRTFHSQRLRELTGIDAAENQARQILSDMRYHRAKHGSSYDPDSKTARTVSAMNWRINRFEPFTARIAELRPDADPIQEFCDYLNFRFAIASERGRDIDSAVAFEEWIEAGMPGFDPLITSQEQDSLP